MDRVRLNVPPNTL